MTATKIPEGSFLVENDSAYHDIAKKGLAVSASALKVFRQSPRDYQAQYLRAEVKRSESPALVIGRAAHALILEGVETFEKSFVMIEDLDEEFGFINPKTGSAYGETTKAWKEAKAKLDEVHPGTTIISKEVWEDCQGMAASVRKHPNFRSLYAYENDRHKVAEYWVCVVVDLEDAFTALVGYISRDELFASENEFLWDDRNTNQRRAGHRVAYSKLQPYGKGPLFL